MSTSEKLTALRRNHSTCLQGARRYRPRCYHRDSGAAARFLQMAAGYRMEIQATKQAAA